MPVATSSSDSSKWFALAVNRAIVFSVCVCLCVSVCASVIVKRQILGEKEQQEGILNGLKIISALRTWISSHQL